jgi:hypothetical protein
MSGKPSIAAASIAHRFVGTEFVRPAKGSLVAPKTVIIAATAFAGLTKAIPVAPIVIVRSFAVMASAAVVKIRGLAIWIAGIATMACAATMRPPGLARWIAVTVVTASVRRSKRSRRVRWIVEQRRSVAVTSCVRQMNHRRRVRSTAWVTVAMASVRPRRRSTVSTTAPGAGTVSAGTSKSDGVRTAVPFVATVLAKVESLDPVPPTVCRYCLLAGIRSATSSKRFYVHPTACKSEQVSEEPVGPPLGSAVLRPSYGRRRGGNIGQGT